MVLRVTAVQKGHVIWGFWLCAMIGSLSVTGAYKKIRDNGIEPSPDSSKTADRKHALLHSNFFFPRIESLNRLITSSFLDWAAGKTLYHVWQISRWLFVEFRKGMHRYNFFMSDTETSNTNINTIPSSFLRHAAGFRCWGYSRGPLFINHKIKAYLSIIEHKWGYFIADRVISEQLVLLKF